MKKLQGLPKNCRGKIRGETPEGEKTVVEKNELENE